MSNEKGTHHSLEFRIFRGKRRDYRWHLKAANGLKIASSGQGYSRKIDCESAIHLIQSGAAYAPIFVIQKVKKAPAKAAKRKTAAQ